MTTLSAAVIRVTTYSPNDPDYQPGGLLTMAYPHHGNNPVYVLFPQTGQYNFHVPAGSTDTVDLTHMDTAVMLHYTAPQPYTFGSNILYGYIDTTDFSKSMQLWFDLYTGSLPADVRILLLQVSRLTNSRLSPTAHRQKKVWNSIPMALPYPPAFPFPHPRPIPSIPISRTASPLHFHR